jgi:transketolase
MQPLSPRSLRTAILEQSKRAGVGHIGCALSVADIIAALYGGALQADSPDHPDRDRFVLSKGHAALALYAALVARGTLRPDQLDTYCADDSVLGVHPEHVTPGVDFCSGSLGLGLSYGCGAALAARLQQSKRRTFVLLSDAECNEGSTWEAVMFAAHHRLSSLTAIIDLNGQQALGYTKDVMQLADMPARWRAFGWEAHEVDGHDVAALTTALTGVAERPRVIIARTTFGKGVSFMENQIAWHYLPLTEDLYRQALAEVAAS